MYRTYLTFMAAEVCVSTQQYSAYNPKEPEQEGPGPIGYLALVLAWAVPGLGHIMVGQKARGFIFMGTIHGLFAAGLLIGGIRSINPPDQAIWTYTQFLSGWPMLVANRLEKDQYEVNYVRPNFRDKEYRRTPIKEEYDRQAGENGIDLRAQTPDELQQWKNFTNKFIAQYPLFSNHPKVQDMGAVYCGIAGMLNLLVMFDVLLRVTGSEREDPTARKKAARATTPPEPKPEAAV